MKLRIKGDSVRLRLTQTEVQTVAETGEASDTMHVAPGVSLAYGLRATDEPAIRAVMTPDAVFVFVPSATVAAWASGDAVSLAGEQDAGSGRTLAILVEKDFACLHKRPDELDAFPNPLADTA